MRLQIFIQEIIYKLDHGVVSVDETPPIADLAADFLL